MKKIIIVSLICSALTFSACYAYYNLKISVLKNSFVSEYKAPLRTCVKDIVTNFENSKNELAIQKLKYLENELNHYEKTYMSDVLIKFREIDKENNKEKTEQIRID